MEDVPADGLGVLAGRPSAAPRSGVTRIQAYTERRTRPLIRRQPPFAGVVLIVGWGAPITLTGPGPDGPRRLVSFVGGFHDVPVDTVTAGVAEGVQVDLTPLGARRLFGVPMSELTNRVLPLDEMLGTWADTIAERLAETPGRAARIALLDEALARRMHAAPAVDARVGRAWRLLSATGGTISIAALAGELGWSHRHLVSRFRDQIGLAPKAAARVLRFERATARLRTGAPPAEVAAACGYYDQAHMNRDFKVMAGVTPGTLAASPPVVEQAGVGGGRSDSSKTVRPGTGRLAAAT
ncbi:AraC family transcriptional regulator [Streptosporangium sp. NPDC048047]|uniref:helix-turn-helix domain-containing protein n=1 Tax=Streptosporangium sp. NPDC048047 TaxID=3155748 RepID=UPI0034418E27